MRNMTSSSITPRKLSAVASAALIFGIGLGHLTAFAQSRVGPPVPPSEPIVAVAAKQIGVRRCLPAISAIAQRATMGATIQDVIIDWDRQIPDAAPFFSLTGLGNGTQRAALTIAAIPTAGGCAVLVERMSSSNQSCSQIAASELQGFRSGELIDGITVYQNPQSASETYTMIKSDGGCLIVRRQASMKWPPAP